MGSATRLPAAATEEAYARVRADERALRPGVDALLTALGVDAAAAGRFGSGSLPVYHCGGVVLKLFPPVHAAETAVEAGVLAAVHGRLPVATPRVLATGERDGWGYVLMSRLPGEPLRARWRQLGAAGRDRLADALGETVAVLHGLPPPRIDGWGPDDWDAFVAGQRETCVRRQRECGLAEPWLAQIPAALDVDLGAGPRVLLHTEIMREHLLVGDGRLTGLIDFEPALRGAAEYEFVAVGTFVAEGDARFLGRFLRAYGFAGAGPEFRRRMVAWSLLHRYSDLAAWLRRLPAPARPDLAAVGDRWFGTD